MQSRQLQPPHQEHIDVQTPEHFQFFDTACFLCHPERWRTIYEGEYVRVVAGKGPLCPGYVLLSPKTHVETVAQLSNLERDEFQLIQHILLLALQSEYGAGYTAYEHGKTGACAIEGDEKAGFCFHAHRVFVPWRSKCGDVLQKGSPPALVTGDVPDLRALGDSHYLYVESGIQNEYRQAIACVPNAPLPSQFFRGLLTDELNMGRPHSWAVFYNVPEMVETTVRLRPWFRSLKDDGENLPMASLRAETDTLRPWSGWISIDGYSSSGKTTIARRLGEFLGIPIFDSGLLFRFIASQLDHGLSVTFDECVEYANTLSDDVTKPSASHSTLLHVVNDSTYREMYDKVFAAITATNSSGILIGRSAWKIVPENATRILIKASFELRAYRALLEYVRKGKSMPEVAEFYARQRESDQSESKRLPAVDASEIHVVDNTNRTMQAILLDIFAILSQEQK